MSHTLTATNQTDLAEIYNRSSLIWINTSETFYAVKIHGSCERGEYRITEYYVGGTAGIYMYF